MGQSKWTIAFIDLKKHISRLPKVYREDHRSLHPTRSYLRSINWRHHSWQLLPFVIWRENESIKKCSITIFTYFFLEGGLCLCGSTTSPPGLFSGNGYPVGTYWVWEFVLSRRDRLRPGGKRTQQEATDRVGCFNL